MPPDGSNWGHQIGGLGLKSKMLGLQSWATLIKPCYMYVVMWLLPLQTYSHDPSVIQMGQTNGQTHRSSQYMPTNMFCHPWQSVTLTFNLRTECWAQYPFWRCSTVLWSWNKIYLSKVVRKFIWGHCVKVIKWSTLIWEAWTNEYAYQKMNVVPCVGQQLQSRLQTDEQRNKHAYKTYASRGEGGAGGNEYSIYEIPAQGHVTGLYLW